MSQELVARQSLIALNPGLPSFVILSIIDWSWLSLTVLKIDFFNAPTPECNRRGPIADVRFRIRCDGGRWEP